MKISRWMYKEKYGELCLYLNCYMNSNFKGIIDFKHSTAGWDEPEPIYIKDINQFIEASLHYVCYLSFNAGFAVELQ